MKRANVAAAAYVLLTFGSGVAVGALGHWIYTSKVVRADTNRSEEFRKRYLDEMQTRLKLTPAQVTSLVEILDSTRSLYRELHEKHKPEYLAIQQLQTAQIRRLLSDAQKPAYEAYLQEREKRRKGARP